jgi:predicted dehydrogenase
MKFPSGIVANCKTTYGHTMPGFYRVIGPKGMIHVEPAFPYQGERFTARLQGETPIDEPNEEKDPAQFVREADHMAECIRENREPKPNGDEGLKDMRLMMEIYRSCGRG